MARHRPHASRLLPQAILALAPAALALCSTAPAATIHLQHGSVNEFYPNGYAGVDDAYIDSAKPDCNHGLNWEFMVGPMGDGSVRRGLIRWDVRALAPLFERERYVVIAAELKLGLWYNNAAFEEPFEIYRVSPANSGWVEGSVRHDPCPGAVTWNAVASGQRPWAGEPGCGKAGVDFDPEPVSRFKVDTLGHMHPRYLQPCRLPVEMLRDWALDPDTNAGLLIRAASEADETRFTYFVGSEHMRTDHGWHLHHPELTVTYMDRQETGDCPLDRIVSDGQSNRLILVPEQPEGSERYAAQELADHLQAVTNCEIPIIPEDTYRAEFGPVISVGRTEMSRQILSDDALAALGDEGSVIDVLDDSLVIVGGRRRGALYGVYDYLEGLGVRWFTPTFTLTPRLTTIGLPAERTRSVPKAFYRDQLWNNGSDSVWRARARLNGEYARLPDSMGGSTAVRLGCHSYHVLAPSALFGEHPDWFAVKDDGERHGGSSHGVELCGTNAELREHILQRVQEDLRTQPQIEHYWVSQDDGFRSGCLCEACTAERRAHGGEDRWAANTISLANYVAEGIRDEFPSVLIKTLAYSYTTDPPKNMAVADNVLVVICGPQGCWFHPYATCPATREWRRRLRGWTSIAANVQTYMYGGSNYGYLWPFPTWLTMCKNTASAYDDGVRALYRQGTAAGYGSEFAELRAYLSARAMADPERDFMGDVIEFTDAYYGPASPFIRGYIDWYDSYITVNKLHDHHQWGNNRGWQNWVNDEVIDVAGRLFRQALQAVRDHDEYELRVRAAHLPILLAEVLRAGTPEPVISGDEYLLLPGTAGHEVQRNARMFARTMAQTGYNRWNEQTGYDAATNPVAALGRSHRLYRLTNGADEVCVVPSLGGRIVKWDVAAANGNIMHLPTDRIGNYPYAGGYEEYSQWDRSSPGFAADFVVSEFSERRRLVMRASLPNGLDAMRTFTLSPDAPHLAIESAYTNVGAKPIKVTARNHPEFNYAKFNGSRLLTRTTEGQWNSVPLARPDAPQGERTIRAEEVDGVWLFADEAANWGLVNVFDPAAVETLYCFWGESFAAMNLELWGVPTTLGPGESCSLSHAYEYVSDLREYLAK